LEEIIKVYEEMAASGARKLEIEVGLGNACYNSYHFLEAEQHYLKALDIRPTEKVYEYLAWIMSNFYAPDEVILKNCQKCLELNPKNLGARYLTVCF
jgi:tetratricopeptide (TPR) repeat protein